MPNINLKFSSIKPVVWIVILISIVTLACGGSTSATPEAQVESFSYSVRVLKDGTNQYVPNATVTIEVSGLAPLQGLADVNGFTRIFIDASYVNKPARLLVVANEYEPYRREIDLIKDALPDTIPLKPAPNEPTFTSTTIPTTTPISMPEPTSTNTPELPSVGTAIPNPTNTSTLPLATEPIPASNEEIPIALPFTMEVNQERKHPKYDDLLVTLTNAEIAQNGSMRWNLVFWNQSKRDYGFGFNLDESYVSDEFGQLYEITDASIKSGELIDHRAGLRYAYWFDFPAVKNEAKNLTLSLQDRQSGGPHPPFNVVLPVALQLPLNQASTTLANSSSIEVNQTVKHPKYDDLSVTLTTVDITENGLTRWHLLFWNQSKRDYGFGFNLDESYVSDEFGQLYEITDASIKSGELIDHRAGLRYAYWFDFPAVKNEAKNLTLSLQDRQSGGPHPPFNVTLP